MRDPARMLELLRIFLPTLAKLFRVRRDLLIENLLLRRVREVVRWHV